MEVVKVTFLIKKSLNLPLAIKTPILFKSFSTRPLRLTFEKKKDLFTAEACRTPLDVSQAYSYGLRYTLTLVSGDYLFCSLEISSSSSCRSSSLILSAREGISVLASSAFSQHNDPIYRVRKI